MLTEEIIKNWLVQYLSQLVGVTPEQINPQTTFSEYGLESGILMGFTADLEKWLNVELSIDVLFEYPTVDALARHVHAGLESLAKVR